MTDGYGNTLEVQEEDGRYFVRVSPKHSRALATALKRLGFPADVQEAKDNSDWLVRSDSSYTFEETLDTLYFREGIDLNSLQDLLDSLQIQTDLENESVVWQRVC